MFGKGFVAELGAAFRLPWMSAALTKVAGREFAGEAAFWGAAALGAVAKSANRSARRPSIAFIADSFFAFKFSIRNFRFGLPTERYLIPQRFCVQRWVAQS
jgi:hypothetical protein